MPRRDSVTNEKEGRELSPSVHAESFDLQARDRDRLLNNAYFDSPDSSPSQLEGPFQPYVRPRRKGCLSRRLLFLLTLTIIVFSGAGYFVSNGDPQKHITAATCFVKSKLGVSTQGSECSHRMNGPSHYVPVWTADPFPGQLDKRELAISDEDKVKYNVSNVYAVMRTAVIDTHPFWGSEWRMIRIVGSIYDFPFHPERHIQTSKLFLENTSPYQMRAFVKDLATSELVAGRKDFRDSREIQFAIPASLFNVTEPMPTRGDTGDTVVPLTFELTLNDVAIETWTFNLRQKWIPYAKMSICMKPLYAGDVPDMLVEWREHHRILGWPLVHWQHRHAGLGKVIDELNKLTGGYDTFNHAPRFESNERREDIWDESMTFNECYIRHKQASDFIGVWDLDEYVAPTPDKPWTPEWVEDYLATNWSIHDPNAAYLQMPMTWLDKHRFGPISDEKLLAVDSSLSKENLHDVSDLHLATDGYYERHGEVYVKSIQRTSKARGANIHHGWGGPPTWQEPVKLVIYHARRQQYWPANLYEPWPVNESVIAHWKALVERIRKLKLNKVYEVNIAASDQVD